ncbi:MAG: TolC family protein [Salinivirgaceae bacterium]|nr:TolC family protein [Salinivirgaceae bacterium]
MKRISYIIMVALMLTNINNATAQQQLTLEQCREMALQNNVKIKNADLEIEAAQETQKGAFTKRLPTVNAVAAYVKSSDNMLNTDKVGDDIKGNISSAKEQITADMTNKAMQLGAAAQQAAAAGDLAAAQQYQEQLTQLMAQASQLSQMGSAMSEMLSPMLNSMMNGIDITGGPMASLNAMMPLFAGGQINNGNKLADVAIEVKEIQKKQTTDEVLLTTERYYCQLITLIQKMNTINALDSMLQSIEKDVNAALQAKVCLRNDSLQVQLKKNELQNSRIKLENGIELSKMVLAQYIGLETDDFMVDTAMLSPNNLQTPDQLKVDHETALQNRAEFQLLEKKVEASQLQMKMERGKLMPTVAVGGSLVYHKMAFDANTTFGMLYATVSIPISDLWGSTSHDVKKHKLEIQSSQNTQKDLNKMLIIQMQQSYNSLQQVYLQVQLAQRSIEQAKENLEINRNSYRAGMLSVSDLLQAQMLLQKAYDMLTDSLSEYAVALTNYKMITGQN